LDPERIALAGFLKHREYGIAEQMPEIAAAARPVAERLDALAAEGPEGWETLPDTTLELLAYSRILTYAYTNEAEQIPLVAQLYGLVIARLPWQDRARLLHQVSFVLDSHGGQLAALVPFLHQDPDVPIVSTAALNLACLSPLEDGDVLTGPKRVRAMAAAAEDERRRVGLLLGLLAVGDNRVLPVLGRPWEELGPEGLGLLSGWRVVAVNTLLVEFFVGWMDAVEPDGFALPAAALARMPGSAQVPKVFDMQRRLPATLHQERNPVTVRREWTFSRFARITLEPRLRVLAGREGEGDGERVIPGVMAAWGIR
jgi:hypothetical protein